MFRHSPLNLQKVTFTWSIENFSSCKHETGEGICSPKFSIDSAERTRLFLKLYPRGDIGCKNNVSVFIHRSPEDTELEPIHGKFEFALLNADGLITNRRSGNAVLKRHVPGYGFGDFKDRATLFTNERPCLLPDDILTVKCKILPLKVQHDTSYDVQLLRNLSEDLLLLKRSEVFSDLQLDVGGEPINVHKSILWSRWPSLARQLESENPDVPVHCRTVTDISLPVMKTLLDYFYGGQLCPDPQVLSDELYAVVDRHQIFDLKRELFLFPNEITTVTRIKAYKNSFTWPIRNFSTIDLDDVMLSPVIRIGDASWSWFRVAVKLAGKANSNVVEIQIARIATDKVKPVFLTSKLVILNVSGLPVHSEEKECLFDAQKEATFCTFLLRTEIIEKNSYLHSDTLSLYFEFAATDGEETSEIKFRRSTSPLLDTTLPQEMGTLQGFREDMSRLYNTRMFCDLKICAGFSKFPVHRAILSARSPAFHRILNENCPSSVVSGTLTLPYVDADVMEILLRYIYTAEVSSLDPDTNAELYVAADRFELPALKAKCSYFLQSNLIVENAARVLVLADGHHDEALKEFVQDFACSHSEQILNSREWKAMINSREDLGAELMYRLMAKMADMNREHRDECSDNK